MDKNYNKSEKWLEAELVKRVKAIGGKALKFSSTVETGYPDRLIIMPEGLTYWAEIKSEGEKPRKIQEVRIKYLRLMGHTVFVIDSEESLAKSCEMMARESREWRKIKIDEQTL